MILGLSVEQIIGLVFVVMLAIFLSHGSAR